MIIDICRNLDKVDRSVVVSLAAVSAFVPLTSTAVNETDAAYSMVTELSFSVLPAPQSYGDEIQRSLDLKEDSP